MCDMVVIVCNMEAPYKFIFSKSITFTSRIYHETLIIELESCLKITSLVVDTLHPATTPTHTHTVTHTETVYIYIYIYIMYIPEVVGMQYILHIFCSLNLNVCCIVLVMNSQ